ncbi:axonemal dynein light intermediate polypeptide 1 [Notolabrus celidotus]|uniref:axonemal dynein light intermediate polypeptide 1 n=1 Tax=Notolabrus celidotus TaxID=1203425 RepID=UPI001490276B|nr:axonemal dynein light intermediate polypeptide 1 [Notolabrus celidotus]
MIPQAESLLKYNNPVLISKSTDRKSPKGRPLRVSPQLPLDSTPVPPPPKPKSTSSDDTKREDEELLNAILPPREWVDGNQMWVQQVSSAPCTRTDVVHLEELLDTQLQQRQARSAGICPARRELFSQCFDELIRQVTINCAERGLLLLRVREEIQTTISAYQTLYESTVAFGMRKALQAEQGKSDMEKRIADLEEENQELQKQLDKEKDHGVEIRKSEREKRQMDEKKHAEEIQFLKITNKQLKTQLEALITPKK